MLRRLIAVDGLERFLHKAYLGQKQFSIEGLDMTVPMIDEAIELSAAAGAREVVIGMAHRGRLSVLAHNLGRPYETIFGEFEGTSSVSVVKAVTEIPQGGTGDVKYHHGYQRDYELRSGGTVLVNLESNPSHLEFVDPVVLGATRAAQTSREGARAERRPNAAVPIILHGDAAFPGQGIVAETLNLQALDGYQVGGALHLVQNNQIGFTTDFEDSRSTQWASDLAKGFDVPIIHVNADDVEACDQRGAPRDGLPRGVRPRRPDRPDRLPALRPQRGRRARVHAARDVRADQAPRARREPLRDEADRGRRRHQGRGRRLAAGHLGRAHAPAPGRSRCRSRRPRRRAPSSSRPASTSSTARRARPSRQPCRPTLLRALNDELLTAPEGFTVHPKLVKQLEKKREAVGAEGGIDWSQAEALAFASLLVDGVPIRMTGQDAERGTFSQRHMVLHDAKTGQTFSPIQHLAGAQAPIELHNSPLSETACLGFEFGYSQEAPEVLVLWEAQFGDFANGAQVIIDQFIASGLAKWGQSSRLTLLLPHGYEGSGPEHSSARLERFLQLAAEGNIRVANLTTPAQYFHLIRRQALIAKQRPLVVMTPKSLLRLPQATNRIEHLSDTQFFPVLGEPRVPIEKVTRLILCTGKIYYDLVGHELREGNESVAIGRVELLYPFPEEDIRELIDTYPNLEEVLWVQEEPRNMGARAHMSPRLLQILPDDLEFGYVGRPERASPGEGYPAAHNAEQNRILATALDVERPGLRVPEEDSGRALGGRRQQAVAASASLHQRRDAARSAARFDVGVRQRPSPSNARAANTTGSSASTTRAPTAPNTLRASACAQTAPNMPVLAPTTATSLPLNGLSAIGRESQSIAFFSAPGIEWLYSGVANSTASDSRRSRAAPGPPRARPPRRSSS